VIEDGASGVVTTRGTILADHVVVCAGLWGRLIAKMAGEDLPLMPVDHPLTFFGPYNVRGSGAEIGNRHCATRQFGPHARHRRSDDGRGRPDRVGLLRGTIRASCIRATCFEGQARLCPHSGISTWSRSLSPWSGRWS
jgi:glycine/D-amino acid oxidase-like deaminating enzyme